MSISLGLVCITDDDQTVRLALARFMQTHGYDSMSFSRGRECLDGQEIDQADVVIIDVSMLSMDGFELHTLNYERPIARFPLFCICALQ